MLSFLRFYFDWSANILEMSVQCLFNKYELKLDLKGCDLNVP